MALAHLGSEHAPGRKSAWRSPWSIVASQAKAQVTPLPFFNPSGNAREAVRRDRHRRRPQRPRHGGLSRARREVGAGARAPAAVGGAAVTEEIFPGFKFTMFSYVVSCCGPRSFAISTCRGMGLHILPLESTVTPMENGDYFAAWAITTKRGASCTATRPAGRRGVRRVRAPDAFFMAQAVKPILGMVPPDPTSFAPSDLIGLLKLGKHFRGLGGERLHALVKLMTMSSADFLDEWFETDRLESDEVGERHHRTFLGPRSPGTAYVLLHHYMGELDGCFGPGDSRKGARAR